MNILVCEDNATSLKLLSFFVQKLGDFDDVTDGQDAVDAIELSIEEGTPYDLIFLDLKMPEHDGWEILEFLRKTETEHGIDSPARVIVTSVVDPDDPKNHAFRDEISAYLKKPFAMKAFKQALADVGCPLPG